MSPQEVRAFDEQQTACARLFYHTDQGYLQGYMELDTWHWTAPAIYSSEAAPYPLELSVTRVDHIAYVWDEYCDKFSESSHKCGDYKMATFQGRPALPAASSTTPHA
ncbi:unnamed protein product [Symbiodinium pilosum]|uniref:Uncharacterized protein n=1 Tax=Symbiodinium pilosum TaxID=2952 RepID=A0A812U6E4_SYMPI|nr:unnamed protein product [Symbiodinium pilosum]